MSEVTFAKSFLSALGFRPQKLSADHVEDPKKYPARPPYILPKMSRPMCRAVSLAPGQERSVTVSIKSLRNPPLDVRLTSQRPETSILDVKTAVAAETRISLDKIKILHRKKPVADSKVLKDLLGDAESNLELSVMLLGALPPAAPAAERSIGQTAAADSVAQAPSGLTVLQSDAFWSDLRGFLLQRIRDEKTAEALLAKFVSSYEVGL